jgi:glycosyltransferase involved in cell wall biosynthesis
MRLLIISDMPHYMRDDQVVGWGPTVQEINALAQEFDSVKHIACLHTSIAPLSSLPYTTNKIRLIPVLPAGGSRIRDKLDVLSSIPTYIRAIKAELPEVDVVHVRCPANISLIAILLLALVRQPYFRWVKYAGNWRPAAREPLSYTLQRWWLARRLHRGVVTVNGRWLDQPGHVYTFFNPSLTLAEVAEARRAAERKLLEAPLSLLFVGRVESAKGVGRLLQIAEELRSRVVPFELHIVGDGPERPDFERQVLATGLGDSVAFHGWQPRTVISNFYARAHFLVFPTTASEGWPKVLSEAMAYGVVPIVGAVSSIPQVLGEIGSGTALPSHDIQAFADAIVGYAGTAERWKTSSDAGVRSASMFTYDYYLESVRRLFWQSWSVSLAGREAEIAHE